MALDRPGQGTFSGRGGHQARQRDPQVEIKLGRPHVFKGRVVESPGQVHRRGRRLALLLAGIPRVCLSSWTDANGRFRWTKRGRDITLSVNKQGFRSVEKQFAPSTEDVVFTLSRSSGFRASSRMPNREAHRERNRQIHRAVHPTSGEPIKWSDLPTTGFASGVYRGVLGASFPVVDNSTRSGSAHPVIVRSSRGRSGARRRWLGYDIALRPGTDVHGRDRRDRASP